MRVLRTVVHRAVLPMFDTRQHRSHGGTVAFQLIGHHHPWYTRQPFERLTEKRLSRRFVPPALDENIEDVPVLIHRPPQIVTFTGDREKDLIQVPCVTWPGTSVTELIGILLPTRAASLPDRFVAHRDAAGEQPRLNIVIPEAAPEREPDLVADNLGREAVVLVAVDGWWAHEASIAYQAGSRQAAQQVDNAGISQISPDLVVKSQVIDITKVI
jgi:hypothetical protein